MALGNPFNIGSTAAASGVATTVVTAGTDANGDATTMPSAGNSLFVLIGMSSATVSPSTVTDSRGNTYTRATNGAFVAGNGQSAWIYECLNPAATLVSTNTVTVTWSATTAATSNVRVIACAGVATSSADDQAGTGSATSTSATATAAGALAQASELAIAVVQSGNATGGITSWGTFGLMGHNLHSGSGSYFGVATLDTTSTAAPSASATMATSGNWAMLLLTFKASTAGAGGLSIVNTSPLPGGQVGVAYSDQLTATGGITPYTWALTSGSLPAGITLEPGGGGGGSGDFTYVGVNTGPQGAPTVAQFNASASALGPFGCYKFFFNALPTTWSGTLMDQITTSGSGGAGVFCYISWNTQATASQISQFVASIPHTITEVGFSWQSEVENGPQMTAAAFQSGWQAQAIAIQAARATTPVKLTLITSSFMGWYQNGGNSSYQPPAQYVDVYGIDFYDRKIYWAGTDMSSNKAWTVWSGQVKGFGKPLALTEYGISGAASAAEQNTRLQADLAYLKNAFGPGGSLSHSPLYAWLYWNTSGTSTSNATNINQMTSAAVQNTWQGIANLQGGGGVAAGGGGLLSGTPTTAAVSTPTIRVTDAASTTSSTAFSLTISAAGSLAVTSTGALPGGTTGTVYSTVLTATGGTVPYTWAVSAGSLPPGLAISGQFITGTPTVAGTYAFTVQVTDNVSATATAAVSLTISGGLAVTTASLPAGQVGVVYTATLASAGGTPPYTWSLASGVVPDGLILDTVAGTISGTPTTAGSYPLGLQVTDAALTMAASAQPVVLAVAPASGGLPAVGRRRFGGDASSWAGQFVGDAWDRAPGVTVTFWNAISGGLQYTDLQTTGGVPIDHITTDAFGEFTEFYGPDSVLRLCADANGGLGPRRWITCTDLADMLATLYAAGIVSGLHT